MKVKFFLDLRWGTSQILLGVHLSVDTTSVRILVQALGRRSAMRQSWKAWSLSAAQKNLSLSGSTFCDEPLMLFRRTDPLLTVRDTDFGLSPAVEVHAYAHRQWCNALRGAPASGLRFTEECRTHAAHIRSFQATLA